MDRLLRHAAPLILLALALLAWFEHSIPGSAWFAATFGADTGLRIVVGAACVYLAVSIVERQQLARSFRQVLDELRRFRDAAGADVQGHATPDAELRAILVAALRSEDPSVRRSARAHLTRLCGTDHGDDPAAWQTALRARFPDV